MITSYFDFFYRIFEANETELAESFINKLYKARILAAEKVKAKAKKLEEEPNISDTDLRKYLNKDVKLTDAQEKEAKDIALTDPYFNRIKTLTKDKKEWLPTFLQFFFSHFKNSRPDADRDYDLISSLIGEYNINSRANYGDVKVDNLSFGKSVNNIGSIGKSIKQMIEMNPNVVKKVLGTIPTIVKIMNIQNTDLSKITTDSFKQIIKGVLPDDVEINSEDDVTAAKELLRTVEYSRKGYEILSDNIRDLGRLNDIEFLISRLPKGIESSDPDKKRPNLIEEYEKLSDSDKLTPNSEYTKKDLKNLFGDFVDVCAKNEIPLKVSKSEGSVEYPYEAIFMMRRGTAEDKQVDKNLDDFYDRLKKTVYSFNNSNVAELIKNAKAANKKFGEGSVIVVYNQDNKVVININNYEANHFLHDHISGKKQTLHCIAYGKNHWNTHVGEDNKLYYVYNFNLEPSSVLFPFGVIINPKGKVTTSYDKKDENSKGVRTSMTQQQVEKYMRDFGIPYNVLQPLSPDEVSERLFRKNAQEALVSPGISVETLRKIIEKGVDVNYRNCQAMINALQEGNLEKFNLLRENGARINNLGVERKSGIVYAATSALIKRLVELGEDINYNNGEPLRSAIANNSYTVIERLLDNNVDVKILPQNIFYYTKSLEMIIFLFKKGFELRGNKIEAHILGLIKERLDLDNNSDVFKICEEILEYYPNGTLEILQFILETPKIWTKYTQEQVANFCVNLMVLIALKSKKINKSDYFSKGLNEILTFLEDLDKDRFQKYDIIKLFVLKLKEKQIKLPEDFREELIDILENEYKELKASKK